MSIPNFLLNYQTLRLIFFGGKGGVGKTTCASATAFRLARQQQNATFLLVSTDPAHSLTDSLAGAIPPSNLQILELDAQACLANFKENHYDKLREIASRGTFLDNDDINKLLDLSLPGLDELMAFLEVAAWVEAQRYDCIIMDTAPTGHTLRLLEMPTLLRQWVRALDTMLAKHRYMKRMFNSVYKPDALDDFLEALALSIKQMETLLQDTQRCCFVPVMIAEALSVNETRMLLNKLKSLKVPVNDIIVNKLFLDDSPASILRLAQQQKNWQPLMTERSENFWAIPQYAREVCGLEALNSFWDQLIALNEIPPSAVNTPVRKTPIVENPAQLPLSEVKLYLFTGKGGVGKTTLACATALRLAKQYPKKKILLFSTDPAHSLSDCLNCPIQSEPTVVSENLAAIAINAQAAFEKLKQEYALEVENLFESLLQHIDMPLDRQVMERIMDLSPPGIDEVIALTQVMEFLTEGQYDVLILDTAPTGHFIRFLELPELIDKWLKTLFGIFLKYKQIFRLPKVLQQLVNLSKDLKRWRAMLHDAEQSVLYGVSILEEMAFQETKDLIAATERMEIKVPGLFLNLATPIDDDPLSIALHQREFSIKDQFVQAFPKQQQTLVYRRGEPRGVAELDALGKALYHF